MSSNQEQETIGLLVHSYNNFLAGMMGFTELSLMEVEQEDVRERLELALSSGKDAVVFGKQLLSMISRLQVQFTPIDLTKILGEIAEGNGLTLETSYTGDKLLIDSEAQWLWFCLESLCQFCRNYAPDSQATWVVEADGSSVLLNLNTRLSFTKEQSEQLFEPFFTSRHLLGQKDVGLAFVSGFVKQMGGDIRWVEEQGFVITLPLSKNG